MNLEHSKLSPEATGKIFKARLKMTQIMTQEISSKRWLMSIHEVSTMLGMAVHTIYSWVNQRKIPYVKVGRLLRFDPKDIENWISKNKVEIREF